MFKRIIDFGVRDGLRPERIKRIRALNFVALLTIAGGLLLLLFSMVSNWGLGEVIITLILLLAVLVPLALNYNHHDLLARLYFLFASYGAIVMMPIMFGPELHFQYYLLGGISMPLLLLGDEIGKWKFFVSSLAIVFWAYLEWHSAEFAPLWPVPIEYHSALRIFNDLFVFITVFGTIFIFISESDKHLDVIEEKNATLIGINDQLKQYTSFVSHDLKSPLNRIVGLVGLIKLNHKKDMNKDLSQMVDMIDYSANQSSELITSVLDYSRVGQDNVETSTFSLNELLDEISALIKMPEGFSLVYEGDLPLITTNFTQLQQVLMNLINNAINHHDQETGQIEVSVEKVEMNTFLFSVKDDGPGIQESDQERIFELFQKAGSKQSKSTGIGLAIVKKLVHINHGKLGVESTWTGGARFWFTWPSSIG